MRQAVTLYGGKSYPGFYDARPEAYGAVGDGVTDDTDAFDAMFAAFDGQIARFLLTGIYALSRTITPDRYHDLFSARRGGGTSNPTRPGGTLVALTGFTGDAMVQSWATVNDDYMHFMDWSNLRLECDGNVAHGMAIHQMGESSQVVNVEVRDATSEAFLLTGAHARAALFGIRAWDCPLLKLTSHATHSSNNSGLVLLEGSCDGGEPHVIYCDGAHMVSGTIKHEGRTGSATRLLHIAGGGTGGGRSYWRLDGVSDRQAQTSPQLASVQDDMVYIESPARPSLDLTIKAYYWENLVDDPGTTRALPSKGAASDYGVTKILWGASDGDNVYAAAQTSGVQYVGTGTS